MAFLLLCGFSLAACNNGASKVSWEEDKESITKSIQTLDEEQKKEDGSTRTLLAAMDSRLQTLEAVNQTQQEQIEALSAQMEEQKQAGELGRIEAQKRIKEQKRMLEQKYADELKQIELQKRRQMALQRAQKAAAIAKAVSESKQAVAAKKMAAPPAVSKGATKANAAAAIETEKNAYTAAYLALKSGRFDEASKAFNTQLDSYPNGEYADQAWYWLGETRYAQHGYDMASNAFKYVTNNFPNSVKRAAALLKLGQISQIMNRDSDAVRYYNRLIKQYGDNSAAEQARVALAKMQKDSQGQ